MLEYDDSYGQHADADIIGTWLPKLDNCLV